MTELLPEKELVTRALASSRDGMGNTVQLHASHAHATPWLWAGWKSNVLCLGFPICQSRQHGYAAVVPGKEEEHEVSPATSKGAGLVPAPTPQCALLSCAQPTADFLPFSWRHSQRWHRTTRHSALVSQDDAHIFLRCV